MRPLYEIFICYGQEEFFDCKEEVEEDGKPKIEDMNFPSMVESKLRRESR